MWSGGSSEIGLATGRLKGRIRSSDGKPIKGARIDVQSIFVGDGCSFEPDLPEVTSSADGQFSFSAGAKGTATLEIKHPDFAPRTANAVVPSTGADIVLDDGASWEGRVFDPVATDELSPLGERPWRTKTRIAQAEHRAQDLTGPKGVTLTGVIVDQGGSPIAEARLSATPEPWNGRPDQKVIVRADGSGHFAFRHLAPGRWMLEGDYRAALKGSLGKVDIDGTTNRDQLRLIVPEPKPKGH